MRSASCSKSPKFKDLVRQNCPPLVFKGALIDWSPGKWTLSHINSLLGDKLMTCKVSSVGSEEFQWETECVHVQINMQQYIDWLQDHIDEFNPLKLFDRRKFSCYIDYKYMKDMFKDHPDILKSASWKMFGLHDRDGEDSTIWIGSQGAYTPCHQDTYGFNLVAQIQGRKRWYLFDPSQTDCMYPTRIPFEESSVYSEVNIRNPDLFKHPLFKKTTPYVVELFPGDTLYVPRHWWHFVESLDSTIAINTWVPLAADKQSRLEESISRLLFSALASTILTNGESVRFLNTGEEIHEASVNVEYVQTAIQDLITNKDDNTSVSDLPSVDKTCTDSNEIYFDGFVEKFKTCHVIISESCSVPFKPTSARLESCEQRIDSQTNEEHGCETSRDVLEARNKSLCKKRKIDLCECCGAVKEQNKDNTDLADGCRKCEEADNEHVDIYAIPAIRFENFIHFLEDGFGYETMKDEKEINNLKKDDSCAYPPLHDIFNAVLEPGVISHVSSVLMNKTMK